MLKIVEIFQQKGTDHKALLIVSCSIYSFLIWVSETNQRVFFKIRPDIQMLKIVEIFQQKGQIIRRFLLFLVPYIRFLFESLKLIRQFSPRFDQISGCSNVFRYFNIFQKFLLSSKFLLFHTNVSYFSTLHQKSFFLEQNQFLQLLKWVDILHQNFNFDFVCRIIVPQWRRKKLLFI